LRSPGLEAATVARGTGFQPVNHGQDGHATSLVARLVFAGIFLASRHLLRFATIECDLPGLGQVFVA